MKQPNDTIISVRVSKQERLLLERAAEDQRTTLSDFVRRKSIEAAEIEVLSRTSVTIPAADWEKLETWFATKPKPNAALKTLARRKPSWQD